jgi:hypothetical protein
MSAFEKYVPHAHFSVAIATVLLVIVGVWGVLETRSALQSTQRAWIVPLGAQLSLRVEGDRGIRFAVNVMNTGREPAVDVNLRLHNYVIDSYNSRITDMRDIIVPPNNTCDGLEPIAGRSIVPPEPNGTTATQWALDSQHGEPSLLADDKIVSGSKFYVAEGCFAYNTYRIRHTSSFCYVMEFDEMRMIIGNSLPILPDNVVLPPNTTLPQGQATPIL